MRKRFLAGLLALILLLTACAAPPEEVRERPQIQITVVRGKYPYAPAELLMDDPFRAELEDLLDVTILLEEVWDIGALDESVDITFTGGLMTNDCYWMVSMTSGYQLEKMEPVTGILEPQYGRLGSATYSYVFSDPYAVGTEPVLVADMALLREVGADRIPYTEEGVYDLLVALSEGSEVPLAVYGSPAGEGFGCLLGLYGLAPTGGREFYLESGEICFDKISDRAEQYLRFVSRLYSEGLIDDDCVSLNEYACRNLFLSGKAAMAMFPNGAFAAEAVAMAREKGIEAVAVTVPVAEGRLRTDTYNRPIGLISYGYPYARELRQIYEALQERVMGLEPSEDALRSHGLFTGTGAVVSADPVEKLLPEIGVLYKKQLMDRTVIGPYYARLLTGSLPLESGFREMRQDWLNPYAQIGEADPQLSGANMMQIINGWYYKDQKKK